MIPGVSASTLDEDRPDASEGQHDRALKDLARRVTGAWPLVAAVWEELRARHGIYQRADMGANDQIAFLLQAMAIADRSDLLRRFAFKLLKKDLVDGEFGTAVAKFLATRGDVSLQRYENNGSQSVSALVAGRRLLLACEQVCRIDIDGSHAGTGVLVAPAFVATAAHVVHDLLDLAMPYAPRQQAGSLGRLALYCGDVDDFAVQSAGPARRPSDLKPAVLRDRWLAYASLATDNERSTTFDINDVFGIGLPEGLWNWCPSDLEPRSMAEGLYRRREETVAQAIGYADRCGAPGRLIVGLDGVLRSHPNGIDCRRAFARWDDANWRLVNGISSSA